MAVNIKNSSSLNKVAHGLGSIKLAVPLLVAIAAILIGTTFYEAEVGSVVVQQEIYKSPWFGGLMFLLAVNLGTSTLLRYPWKGARKIGFAITHWGLVVIIAGSAAVIHLSVEGMMLARTDAGAVNTLRVEGDLVEVATPDGNLDQAPLFIKADGTVVPSQVGGLSLLGYSNNTINTVHFEASESKEMSLKEAPVDNPAVRLVLQSARMGQTLERWLAIAPKAYDTMDIGPASLQIIQAENEQSLQAVLSEPAADEAVMAQPKTRWGTVTLSWLDQTRSIDIEKNLNQPIELTTNGKSEIESENSKLTVEATGFWPDFRLDANRQPTTATDLLRNPAVQIEIATEDAKESWFVFGKPGFDPIRTQIEGEAIALDLSYDIETSDDSNSNTPNAFFRIVVDAKGDLHYAAKSSKGFKSGPMAVGDAVTPGWADFEVTLAEYIPQARVAREIVPLPQGSPEQGSPALLVATNNTKGENGESEPVWIGWGEPTTVESELGDWYVAFSPKLLQLPFSLKLNDFIVERNEGSESVAMWTSDVSLIDSQAEAISHRRVWMNHPTWFKGWKIAQASWNPGDLSQSTLQVKREPWWVTGLTWLGSTMVTIGVATMFYGRAVSKAIAKRFKKVSDLLETPDTEPDSEKKDNSSIPIFNALLGR
ncbi:MAG: cytochrome c biogenesis protein ResB [Cyanobacteria bacterium J06621_11]